MCSGHVWRGHSCPRKASSQTDSHGNHDGNRSSKQQPTKGAASLLSIRSIAKHFGKNIVLRDISLEIAEGEFLTILGESGSGKTTLLRILAGFEHPTSGEVWMQGERLDTEPPYRRRVNTVFQHYALFPHMTVEQNVGYGLQIAKRPAAEIESRVAEALAKVKMSAYAKSKPSKISGGQQQRIALARALVNRPRLLLLDEPLSALDANLRRQMQVELKALQREVGITFIFVTHDQEEAMVMSDRIALLRSGELEQVASPREIYNRPATSYTAQFIGHTNLLQADHSRGTAMCDRLTWPTSLPDGDALFSLRPECIRLAKITSSHQLYPGAPIFVFAPEPSRSGFPRSHRSSARRVRWRTDPHRPHRQPRSAQFRRSAGIRILRCRRHPVRATDLS
jgi:ABC-type Fe3+/spermidine/putrescine transport system ATPase subunit